MNRELIHELKHLQDDFLEGDEGILWGKAED